MAAVEQHDIQREMESGARPAVGPLRPAERRDGRIWVLCGLIERIRAEYGTDAYLFNQTPGFPVYNLMIMGAFLTALPLLIIFGALQRFLAPQLTGAIK
jgi:hypothetical protein